MNFLDVPMLKSRALLLAALLLPLVAARAAEVVPDLLQRPALESRRASHAVMLAVARAGTRLVAVGELGIVLLSDDNGRTWSQARRVPVSVALTNVQFVSAQLGWAIGHGGVVLQTNDAGQTWSRQLDGIRIAELAEAEARAVAAAGGDASALTRNAERLVHDGPDKPLLGLYFADDHRGWVVGAYGLALSTADGGRTWQTLMSRIPNRMGLHLNAIAPTAEGLVIAAEQGNVFLSHDGGAHFDRIESDYPGSYFGALAQGDALIAYGLRGNAWRYQPSTADDDSGHWQPIDLGEAATLTAGLRLDNGKYLLVDEGAHVFCGDADTVRAVACGHAPVAGVSGMARAADGALVLATLQGPYRLDLSGAGRLQIPTPIPTTGGQR